MENGYYRRYVRAETFVSHSPPFTVIINTPGDGRTDGRTDGHQHRIIVSSDNTRHARDTTPNSASFDISSDLLDSKSFRPKVSDSTASISCGFVVQLAVRLADCCMQLVVDFCCGLVVGC